MNAFCLFVSELKSFSINVCKLMVEQSIWFERSKTETIYCIWVEKNHQPLMLISLCYIV